MRVQCLAKRLQDVGYQSGLRKLELVIVVHAWIAGQGIPAHAWSEETFLNITSLWALVSSKEGKMEERQSDENSQTLVDDAGIQVVDAERIDGIETHAAGSSKVLFNAFVDACNVALNVACDKNMQDTLVYGKEQSVVSDHDYPTVQNHVLQGGKPFTQQLLENESPMRTCHADMQEVGQTSNQQGEAVSREKLIGAQDFSHQTVDIDSELNVYVAREHEDSKVAGNRLSGAVGEPSLWGFGEVVHVGSLPVTNHRLSWEESVDMTNSVQKPPDVHVKEVENSGPYLQLEENNGLQPAGIHPILVAFTLFAFAFSFASASDPSPLQDFCVAVKDIKDGVFVNGKLCKDPKLAVADDFFFSGLNKPGNTSNQSGFSVTPVAVDQIPGLNTLGISLARIDYAPNGLNPPHTHPRGTEILLVVKGTLYVGFVTSIPDYRLFTKILNPGDVFVFPMGLIHFQFNIGKSEAVAFGGLSSQNAGVIAIANAVFGSNPPINPDVLAKAFQLDKDVVKDLQSRF
ncbi:hypothetical protein V6N11_074027 [Hibiscus sabdariffa]|uniref:Cupin type-1 domain-containing protein n=2 Tax=Hibiscus sabdariffa TaxID=183260 RepID=A0ABR2P631_9ROSI